MKKPEKKGVSIPIILIINAVMVIIINLFESTRAHFYKKCGNWKTLSEVLGINNMDQKCISQLNFWETAVIVTVVLLIIINLFMLYKNIKFKKNKAVVFNIILITIMFIITVYANITNQNNKQDYVPIYKPILYLYPEKTTNVTINFEKENLLLTTYPKFNKEWNVLVKPDGSIYDKSNNYYYALYWEEQKQSNCKFEDGFYVEKENAIAFLEEKLNYIGLNQKERNEFIMYWLPILEKNEKSIIQFDLTEELENNNKLIINPKPDSLLRVHINVKKVNKKTNIKEQKLTTFNRTGFNAVEWGGTIY